MVTQPRTRSRSLMLVVAAALVVVGRLTAAVTPALTAPQLQAIKADIAANSDLNSLPNNEDGNAAIAALYKVTVPTFIVWKTRVAINEIGMAFDSAELAGRVAADQQRLQTIAVYLAAGVNPALAPNRAFFDDIFSGSGGVATRANLLALWKRPAKRVEKLFATGTGTSASPATLVVEGDLTGTDVLNARNQP